MKFEINKEKYIDSGLITEKEHSEFPLLIYNYTPECQYSQSWDDVTMMCRGLIVHKETREIIARPFPKFFNYEEHLAKGDKIPAETPKVYSKFDGSLGILYWWNDEPYIATRGSFSSDQAIWATDFIMKGGVWDWVQKLDRNKTYLFEIIYPENRIVVDYGERKDLVLLGVIDTETGKSEAIDQTDFPFAAEIEFTSFEDLKAMDVENEEGFVLHYPETDKRIKIKFESYVRLHKIITGLSVHGIWEALSYGEEIDISDVPDEVYEWFDKTKSKLVEDFFRIEKAAQELYETIKPLSTRKDQATEIFKNGQRLSGVVFSMLDGKNYQKAIWRMVRPKGKEMFTNNQE